MSNEEDRPGSRLVSYLTVKHVPHRTTTTATVVYQQRRKIDHQVRIVVFYIILKLLLLLLYRVVMGILLSRSSLRDLDNPNHYYTVKAIYWLFFHSFIP